MKSSILKESLEVSTGFLFRKKPRLFSLVRGWLRPSCSSLYDIWGIPSAQPHAFMSQVGGGAHPILQTFYEHFRVSWNCLGYKMKTKGGIPNVGHCCSWVHRPSLMCVWFWTHSTFSILLLPSHRVCYQVLKILNFYYFFTIFTREGC